MIDFDPTMHPLLRSTAYSQAVKHWAKLPYPTEHDLDRTADWLIHVSRIWFEDGEVNQPALDKLLNGPRDTFKLTEPVILPNEDHLGSPLPTRFPFVFMSDKHFAALMDAMK